MVKISQLLLRTEQSSISRPLNLGRDKVTDEDATRDEDVSRDAIFKAEVASFVKHKETYKSNKRKDICNSMETMPASTAEQDPELT